MITIPVYLFLLLSLIPVCTLGLFYHFTHHKAGNSKFSADPALRDPDVRVVRENSGNLTRPIMFVEIENENDSDPLKTMINSYLEQKKQQNICSSASVYFKDLNTGSCFSIGSDSLYDPASILKVPMLMIWLKMAEADPGLLKRSLYIKGFPKNSDAIEVKDRTITAGKYYTVEELLYSMIIYSDNYAFWTLCDHASDEDRRFSELNALLGIEHKIDTVHYPRSQDHFIASAGSVAHYFNVLYNATYLNRSMSLYALKLLTKSNYSNGLAKPLAPGTVIAHKFGERTLTYTEGGRTVDLQTEFHEFGIVYLQHRPYLLGVMTRGSNSLNLQAMVSDISGIVYNEIKSRTANH